MTHSRNLLRGLALALSLISLAACNEAEVAARPDPVVLTVEATGHYCQMTVLDHEGPKAQIHLSGNPNPVWFTQVRDAVAFTRLPEEPKNYTAIYVNDMAKAESWANPGTDNWIEARDAFFVVGSRKAGGMGAPEAIPFGTEQAALGFTAENGGSVVRFDKIPDSYVLTTAGPEDDAHPADVHVSEAGQ